MQASYQKKLGEALRSARIAAGLSLEQVSDKLGMDTGNLSRYKTGRQVPRTARLNKLADLYQVSVVNGLMPLVDDNVGTNAGHQKPSVSPLQEATLDAIEKAMLDGRISDQDCVTFLRQYVN